MGTQQTYVFVYYYCNNVCNITYFAYTYVCIYHGQVQTTTAFGITFTN